MAEAPDASARDRAWLHAVLRDADALLARYGSLSAVLELLEAREDDAATGDGGLRTRLRAVERQRDELQRRVDALAPDAIVRFLKRRAHCVGDVELLRQLLEECATVGGAREEDEQRGEVLMLSVQRMQISPALATLFPGSGPATPTSEAPVAPFSIEAEKNPTVDAEEKEDDEEVLKLLKNEQIGTKSKEPGSVRGDDAVEEEPVADATPVKSLSLNPLTHQPARSESPEQSESRKVSPPSEQVIPPPPKKRRGRPPKVRTEAPTRKVSPSSESLTPPPPKKRRGRPPKNAPKQTQDPPAKRARKEVVSPRQFLEWSVENDDTLPAKDKPAAKLELEFRVVASLDRVKPWDAMYRDRPRVLRIPDLNCPEVLEWVTRCLSTQHSRRQAHWERLHWLPDGCCRGVQWEKYKEARQDRATLADRDWKNLLDDSKELMAKGLLAEDVWCDPALWPLPEKPVLLLPKSVDLHSQIRQADMDEPMRVYYVNKMKTHPFFANPDLVEKYPEQYPEPDAVISRELPKL